MHGMHCWHTTQLSYDDGQPDLLHTTCAEPDCSRPVEARGYCHRHYQYRRTHGLIPDLGVKPSVTERLFANILVSESGCLIWMGGKTDGGYGRFSVNGSLVRVHRYVYERVNGPIPAGLQLDHLCRVRECVNPRHLEPVTVRTNLLRGVGPSAINATKTHCKRGHPFDAANTYIIPATGDRHCRTCRRAASKASYHRTKAYQVEMASSAEAECYGKAVAL